MKKATRMIWCALGLAFLGCACPDKRVDTATTPAAAPAPPAVPAPTATAPVEPAPPAAEPAAQPATALPDHPGMPCDARGCASGLTCLSYFGIAGARGPEFRSCEIPCAKANDVCPTGTQCTTIADGPGRVCR